MYTHTALKSLLVRHYSSSSDHELMRVGLQHLGKLYCYFTAGVGREETRHPLATVMEALAVKSQEQFLAVLGEFVVNRNIIGLDLLAQLVYELFATDTFKEGME